MKIQLKRSNVLVTGSAKAPTAEQMEYGELAVNYNTEDPVIFIKDSLNNVIRLTNADQTVEWDEILDKPAIPGFDDIPDVYDGQINVNAALNGGLTATGSNATANQSGNTTRSLSVDTTWLQTFIDTNIVIPTPTTTGQNPPTNPDEGALWWNSNEDSGRLFVYYNEGPTGSSQWVDASPQVNALTESQGDARYISKSIDDTATGHITFSNKITVGTFDMESLAPLPA